MSRLDPLPHDKMDPDFARYYEELARAGGRTAGPYIAYMRNPALFKLNQAYSDSIRASSLTPVERQIAVLVTVRHYNARYAWCVQVKASLAAGVTREMVDAINDRKRPDMAQASEIAIWEVADSLAGKRSLDDATYARALAALGEQRLIDLVATIGYFSLVGTTLRAFEMDPPEDDPIPLKP
jgi:4-carboxymuconolactone decarboxylase